MESSEESRNRPRVRGHPVRQVEIDLIDIAPAPTFGRIIAFNDGVRGFVEMLGRMAIRGIVATADMPTGATDAQMNPPGPGLETFLASVGAGRHLGDRMIMRAGIGHRRSLALPFEGSTLRGQERENIRVNDFEIGPFAGSRASSLPITPDLDSRVLLPFAADREGEPDPGSSPEGGASLHFGHNGEIKEVIRCTPHCCSERQGARNSGKTVLR